MGASNFRGYITQCKPEQTKRLNLVNDVEFHANRSQEVSVLAIAPPLHPPAYHPLLPSFLTPTPCLLLPCRAGRFTPTAKKKVFQEEGGKD